MAKFEYQGEIFQIDDSGDCEIKVSDGTSTVSITLNSGGPTVYKVSTVKAGWWWHHDSLDDAVARACRELVKARTDISPDHACKEMSEFVANLGEKN